MEKFRNANKPLSCSYVSVSLCTVFLPITLATRSGISKNKNVILNWFQTWYNIFGCLKKLSLGLKFFFLVSVISRNVLSTNSIHCCLCLTTMKITTESTGPSSNHQRKLLIEQKSSKNTLSYLKNERLHLPL